MGFRQRVRLWLIDWIKRLKGRWYIWLGVFVLGILQDRYESWINQWVDRQEPGNMLIGLLSFFVSRFDSIAMYGVGSVVLFLFVHAYISTARARPSLDATRGSPSAERAGQNLEWLVHVAEQDEVNLSNTIDYILERMKTEPHLDNVDPFVDLRFYLLNPSVFTLTLKRLEGKLTHGTYGNPSLPQQPEILNHFEMRHGFTGELVLRQWVSPA